MFKVRIVQRGPFWDQDEYDETLNDLGTDVRTELAAIGLAPDQPLRASRSTRPTS